MNVIVWSGGFDSTLLVYREVISRMKSKNKGPIITWSIDFDLISRNKLESEKLVRKSFIDYVKSKYDITINNEIITIPKEIDCTGAGHRQAILFLTVAIFKACDGDKIAFGFHRRDDFFGNRYQFEQLKDKFCELFYKKIELCYPLELTYKYEVLDEVKRAGIERFCWTCETPIEIMKECGKCLPCINKKTSEYESQLNKEQYKNLGKTYDCDCDKAVVESCKEEYKLEPINNLYPKILEPINNLYPKIDVGIVNEPPVKEQINGSILEDESDGEIES